MYKNRYERPESIVNTDTGPVQGIVSAEYRIFQGIPYAAPPVGELRWQSPQPVRPWNELRDVTKPGSYCPQVESVMAGTHGGGDEDCLFLNITTPRLANTEQRKPVIFCLHGGGATGNGSDCGGRQLALGGDVVVVTINYRLGIFGFFGYPGLSGSGSFGLEDQLAALHWVQRNIGAFGGDPDNVTLLGFSFGGFCTTALLASPRAAGLFQRAIIQSAPCMISYPAGSLFPDVPAIPSIWRSPAEVKEMGLWVATEYLGCTDPTTALDCLRRLPISDLLPYTSMFAAIGFGTPALPESPIQVLHEGRFHQVPVLSGITRDEFRMFVASSYNLTGQPLTAEGYAERLKQAFGEVAEQVTQQYPLSDYASPGLAWSSVLTDRVYASSNFRQNQWFAQHVPTYAYEFADRQAPPITFLFTPDLPGGAYHSSELPYVFDLGGEFAAFTPEQKRLSEQMIQYWTNFARTGDPNGSGQPQWPRFHNADAVPYVQLLAPGDEGIHNVDQISEHQLDFWWSLREENTDQQD